MGEVAGGNLEIIPPFIVGGNSFDLTEQQVLEIRDELKPIAAGDVKAITTPERAQEVLKLFMAPPSEILTKMRKVYDRVRALESERETKDDLISHIRAEFPDIMDYYGLLRKTPKPGGGWGARLGQAIGAAKLADEEKAMYGEKQ